jgi:hypothetical protein
LIASLEAAKELNIIPQAISQAKKEGVELGKADKKILAPVNSSSSGKSSGFKNLGKDEYLKLSREEREKSSICGGMTTCLVVIIVFLTFFWFAQRHTPNHH